MWEGSDRSGVDCNSKALLTARDLGQLIVESVQNQNGTEYSSVNWNGKSISAFQGRNPQAVDPLNAK